MSIQDQVKTILGEKYYLGFSQRSRQGYQDRGLATEVGDELRIGIYRDGLSQDFIVGEFVVQFTGIAIQLCVHKDSWALFPLVKELLDLLGGASGHDISIDGLAGQLIAVGVIDRSLIAFHEIPDLKPGEKVFVNFDDKSCECIIQTISSSKAEVAYWAEDGLHSQTVSTSTLSFLPLHRSKTP